MEQELNRIKLVLVEKKKTGKWQPQEIGVSECTMSRWTSNKAQPNLILCHCKTAWCRNERSVKKQNQVLLLTKTLK